MLRMLYRVVPEVELNATERWEVVGLRTRLRDTAGGVAFRSNGESGAWGGGLSVSSGMLLKVLGERSLVCNPSVNSSGGSKLPSSCTTGAAACMTASRAGSLGF